MGTCFVSHCSYESCTAAAPNYLLINRAQLASAQHFLCIFVPSPLFHHGESSFSSMCLDRDAFSTELAERGKMFIRRAGLTWRRAQSMLPAMSLHTTFRRKSKHWGIFHHDGRALGFPEAAQSLGCRDSGFFCECWVYCIKMLLRCFFCRNCYMGGKVLPENQTIFWCVKLCSGTGYSPNISFILKDFLKCSSVKGATKVIRGKRNKRCLAPLKSKVPLFSSQIWSLTQKGSDFESIHSFWGWSW